MKIVFTADLHIKLGQKGVPVSWSKNRYELLIEALVEECKGKDLLIIGGDIFDHMPTMEEQEVYHMLICALEIPTLVFSGNHEALTKTTTFFTFLKQVTNRINRLVTVVDNYYSTDEFDIIPYNKLKHFVQNYDTLDFHNKLLFTHVRGDIPPHVKAEIDLDLLNRWELVVAGDLHSYENSQRNIVYPGSPVTTSFHRSSVDTGIIIVDTGLLTHTWVKLKLPQLIRKTIQAGEEMPTTDYDHTIYEVEGDMAMLGSMLDSELIDKKVVKRETDTALMLDPTMTLQEEVKEYLLYILQLDENTVEAVLQVLNDNMDKIND